MRIRVAPALVFLCACGGGEQAVQRALDRQTGVVRLPAGTVEVSRELVVPAGARELEIAGAPEGTRLRATAGFRGRAILVCQSGSRIRLRDFSIEGNAEALSRVADLPPHDLAFAEAMWNNGLLLTDVDSVTVSNLAFRHVAGYAVLVSRSRGVILAMLRVEDSGSRKSNFRNNTTGGVLFEDGTSDFEIRDSIFRNILGNAVWTHSRYLAPRNSNGRVLRNRFEEIGRDAIQVGHATNVLVEHNVGRRIGYPVEAVDAEGGGTPVAIDTAGNVDHSLYAGNRFEEINGKCIDLDGFHDGQVRENRCVNRGPAEDYPYGNYGIVMNNSNVDMEPVNIGILDNVVDGAKFGGIFVIGARHRVTGNRLVNLNKAGCNESGVRFGCGFFSHEPDLLQSGIYLGRGADRPAVTRGNLVAANEISGHRMRTRCISYAPGVESNANEVHGNRCSDGIGQ